MIQRIQTIWLFLAALATFLGYKLSFFSGNFVGPDNVKNFSYLTAGSSLGILFLTGILGAIILVAIFLFKNRKLQLRLTLGALILSVINIVLYYLQARKFVPNEGSYNITAIVSILVPVFLVLAARGINGDQKLVKSLDRLR